MYIYPKCINIPGKSYPFTGTPIFNNTEKRLPIYRNLSRQKVEQERMTQPPKGRPLEAKLAAGSQLCHTANRPPYNTSSIQTSMKNYQLTPPNSNLKRAFVYFNLAVSVHIIL